jgi:UDPglucose 6-dehydrogenase
MFRSVNVIGYGYVGGAVGYVCERNQVPFNVCDTQEKTGGFSFFTTDVEQLVLHSEKENEANFYFIAVPTPSKEDGSCNTDIIDGILSKLNSVTTKKTYVIIKSTMVPGTCRSFQERYERLCIVSSPEFLREATFQQDMYEAEFVLVGLLNEKKDAEFTDVENMFRTLYSHNKELVVYKKSYEECELFKYTLNVHLAVKVWYFNEIYEICDKLGVPYEKLKSMLSLDKRIGDYGTHVPGPDGKFGYGLSCLPKETRGMATLQGKLRLDNAVLQHIIERNDYFRTK